MIGDGWNDTPLPAVPVMDMMMTQWRMREIPSIQRNRRSSKENEKPGRFSPPPLISAAPLSTMGRL
ncbi:MAG: hypothetical protein Fur0034_11850 [Desulfuromonadia bacterium]